LGIWGCGLNKMVEADRKANADERTGWGDKGLYDTSVKYLDEKTKEMVTLNCVGDQVLHSNKCTATPDTIRATGKRFDRLYSVTKELETKYEVPNKVADSYKENFDEAKESLIRRLENE